MQVINRYDHYGEKNNDEPRTFFSSAPPAVSGVLSLPSPAEWPNCCSKMLGESEKELDQSTALIKTMGKSDKSDKSDKR